MTGSAQPFAPIPKYRAFTSSINATVIRSAPRSAAVRSKLDLRHGAHGRRHIVQSTFGFRFPFNPFTGSRTEQHVVRHDTFSARTDILLDLLLEQAEPDRAASVPAGAALHRSTSCDRRVRSFCPAGTSTPTFKPQPRHSERMNHCSAPPRRPALRSLRYASSVRTRRSAWISLFFQDTGCRASCRSSCQ